MFHHRHTEKIRRQRRNWNWNAEHRFHLVFSAICRIFNELHLIRPKQQEIKCFFVLFFFSDCFTVCLLVVFSAGSHEIYTADSPKKLEELSQTRTDPDKGRNLEVCTVFLQHCEFHFDIFFSIPMNNTWRCLISMNLCFFFLFRRFLGLIESRPFCLGCCCHC